MRLEYSGSPRRVAMLLVFSLAMAGPVHAGPPTLFWDRVTDAWLNQIYRDGDPAKMPQMILEEARTIPSGDGGEHHIFEDAGGTLRLDTSQVGGAILGGIMRWNGNAADTRVPPLSLTRGCAGEPADQCTDGVGFNHRSEMSLGAAACTCAAPVRPGMLDGEAVAYMHCYLGAGGGYLTYALAYPDPAGIISGFMVQEVEAAASAVCLASETYRSDPQLFEPYVNSGGLAVPDGIDTDLWPVAVVMWDGDRVSAGTMIPLVGGVLGDR